MTLSPNLQGVKHIIVVHSAKGGVGKSTMAVNLATGLARKGARVGLLDADVHGPSGSIMMGTEEWPGPGKQPDTICPLEAHGIKFISMGNLVNAETPVIWRGAMVHSVVNQFLNDVIWGELDYLFVDMPPGTGDAQLTISQSVPLTGVIAVSTPQELSLADSLRGIKAFETMQVPLLGLIENMAYFVCDACEDRAWLFGDSGAEMLAQEMGIPLLGKVPIEGGICTSGDRGAPFIIEHPNSASTRAMGAVIDKLLTILEEIHPTRSFDFQWKTMRWDERYPEPPYKDQAQNAPVKAVWQVSSDELGICWPDERISTLSARDLRLACPCASCVDEWSGEALLQAAGVPGDITFSEIRSVGRYAINPSFSDGHKSGIFHFATIRKLVERKR